MSWKWSKMKTSIVIDLSPQIRISYLAKFRFSSYGPKCSWPIKLQDSLKCNISRKKWKNEVYFWHVEKHRNFLQSDFVILCVSSQTYPKNPKYEVCISLQYLQKNMGHDFFFFFFLPPDKYKSFIQGGSIILDMRNQACPKYPK